MVLNSTLPISSLTLVSTTTARHITDLTESGDSLVTQSDGQEIEGEVKQISRTQKIDDTTAAESGATPSSGSILSDHLVSAVQAGITNQVAGNEGMEHFIITFLKDQDDREALNAELKSIIKSGILDLGVLGLWERDPVEVKLEINNNIPRQAKKITLIA